MTGYSADHIVQIRLARLGHYVGIAAYSMFGVIANLVIVLTFAAGANLPSRLAIALSIIAVAVAAILPARSIFQEMDVTRRENIEEWQGSRIEAYLAQVPISTFNALTVSFHTLIALVQLWALFSS
jgi:hypothetical protein